MVTIEKDMIESKWKCRMVNDQGTINLSLLLSELRLNARSMECEWYINADINWVTIDLNDEDTFSYGAMESDMAWIESIHTFEQLLLSKQFTRLSLIHILENLSIMMIHFEICQI